MLTRNGTVDRVSLAGWYVAGGRRLERFVFDHQYAMVVADVDRLVEAMTKFATWLAFGSTFAAQIAVPLASGLGAVWRSTG